MNLRRAVQCGAFTCMIALAMPSVARADDDGRNQSNPPTCQTHDDDDSDDDLVANELESSGTGFVLHEENDRGHDSRDDRNEDDCPVAPPADVPEAPQVLMLSGSAALTGGAAMLIIRRRAKKAALATT